MNTYKDDPCECFKLKGNPDYNATEMLMDVKMHKAISVIQFKVESQIIKKNPGFKLEKRNLLHHINYEKGTIENINCWIKIFRRSIRKNHMR